jgi:hypothetical protein
MLMGKKMQLNFQNFQIILNSVARKGKGRRNIRGKRKVFFGLVERDA